ncbi:MAG: hypothetical protein RMN51_08005 [Verrucomicrobiota bacterium]|nr:hypothetical protein [Limisphaera sp.]MDW8382031.1 hypothetical protein [Verrucomicrobiota bacterium]
MHPARCAGGFFCRGADPGMAVGFPFGWLSWAVVVVWIAAGVVGHAQGTVVLRTGAGTALVSATEVISAQQMMPSVPLGFVFGFTTDEEAEPGTFQDSFTVTVEDGQARTWVLLTADANGVVWAPPAPGASPVDPASLQRMQAEFPALQPVLLRHWAFAVTFLPVSGFSAPVRVHFDLFDNNNLWASMAWFQEVRIPEPSIPSLLGILAVAWRLRQSR